MIIIGQILGAFGALILAFAVRVSIPLKDDVNDYAFVPGQFPFYPSVIKETGNYPAYG